MATPASSRESNASWTRLSIDLSELEREPCFSSSQRTGRLELQFSKQVEVSTPDHAKFNPFEDSFFSSRIVTKAQTTDFLRIDFAKSRFEKMDLLVRFLDHSTLDFSAKVFIIGQSIKDSKKYALTAISHLTAKNFTPKPLAEYHLEVTPTHLVKNRASEISKSENCFNALVTLTFSENARLCCSSLELGEIDERINRLTKLPDGFFTRRLYLAVGNENNFPVTVRYEENS